MLETPHLARATAQILKELRAEHALSQEQLAVQAHVSRSFLAYLEAGERPPSFQGLISLGQPFGLKGWELAALIEMRMDEITFGPGPE